MIFMIVLEFLNSIMIKWKILNTLLAPTAVFCAQRTKQHTTASSLTQSWF